MRVKRRRPTQAEIRFVSKQEVVAVARFAAFVSEGEDNHAPYVAIDIPSSGSNPGTSVSCCDTYTSSHGCALASVLDEAHGRACVVQCKRYDCELSGWLQNYTWV